MAFDKGHVSTLCCNSTMNITKQLFYRRLFKCYNLIFEINALPAPLAVNPFFMRTSHLFMFLQLGSCVVHHHLLEFSLLPEVKLGQLLRQILTHHLQVVLGIGAVLAGLGRHKSSWLLKIVFNLQCTPFHHVNVMFQLWYMPRARPSYLSWHLFTCPDYIIILDPHKKKK